MPEETAKPSLLKRALALIVLLVAGFFLAKALISFLAGILTLVIIVVAIVAVVWAFRIL
jgi:hypothetical protein